MNLCGQQDFVVSFHAVVDATASGSRRLGWIRWGRICRGGRHRLRVTRLEAFTGLPSFVLSLLGQCIPLNPGARLVSLVRGGLVLLQPAISRMNFLNSFA